MISDGSYKNFPALLIPSETRFAQEGFHEVTGCDLWKPYNLTCTPQSMM